MHHQAAFDFSFGPFAQGLTKASKSPQTTQADANRPGLVRQPLTPDLFAMLSARHLGGMGRRVRSPFTSQRFGKHVQGLRKTRGLTQEQLAERCGLAADTIRRLEHASFSPSLDTLIKLCEGLQLSITTLFEGFELCESESDLSREILNLLRTRTDRERARALRVLRALLDEMDDDGPGPADQEPTAGDEHG